ncbi:hypothetical protein BGX33_003156 [Mortierella sp. NVP41]|nr:hypothetical protein BGX33_003156 [Mortierella sp. NVP41]
MDDSTFTPTIDVNANAITNTKANKNTKRASAEGEQANSRAVTKAKQSDTVGESDSGDSDEGYLASGSEAEELPDVDEEEDMEEVELHEFCDKYYAIKGTQRYEVSAVKAARFLKEAFFNISTTKYIPTHIVKETKVFMPRKVIEGFGIPISGE